MLTYKLKKHFVIGKHHNEDRLVLDAGTDFKRYLAKTAGSASIYYRQPEKTKINFKDSENGVEGWVVVSRGRFHKKILS